MEYCNWFIGLLGQNCHGWHKVRSKKREGTDVSDVGTSALALLDLRLTIKLFWCVIPQVTPKLLFPLQGTRRGSLGSDDWGYMRAAFTEDFQLDIITRKNSTMRLAYLNEMALLCMTIQLETYGSWVSGLQPQNMKLYFNLQCQICMWRALQPS